MTTPDATPGSDAAIEQGCTCPVMDNGHGIGAYSVPGQFWINADCPLHAARKDTNDHDD